MKPESLNKSIKPQLTTRDLAFIVVSLVIGMGIFRTPAEVALKSEMPLIFFSAWITGAVMSAIGAVTFAEIGSRLPVAGGFYKIFSVCYSPVFAFMVNWIIVISNAVSTAAVTIMGAEYMAPLLFPDYPADLGIHIVSVAALIFLYCINMLGIRVSSGTLNVLMIIKLVLLAVIISIPFFVETVDLNLVSSEVESDNSRFHAFLLCFVPVFFTYGGYQQTINFGGDVKNPGRAIPRAIFIGMSVILLVYLSVNYSYVKVLGFEKLQHSTTLAADMIGVLLGDKAHGIISVLMFLSVMTFVNVSLISNPRIYYAMAEDNVMPAVFQRVNNKTQVQEYGTTFFCLVILIVLLFLPSFQKLLGFVMFFDSISIIAGVATIYILRRREKTEGLKSGVYRMFGYPYLPALFILIYFGVSAGIMIADPTIFVIGIALFVLGWPLFYLVQYSIKKQKNK